MKKLLKAIGMPLSLIIFAIWFVSCDEEEFCLSTDTKVLFTASLDDIQSRAYGDGTKVNTLIVGVYDEDKSTLFQRTEVPVNGPEIEILLTLAHGQKYNIVFWAQNKSCRNYDTSDLKAITMSSSGMPATLDEAELMDAFSGSVQNIYINKGMEPQYVRLKRPLAQINIGTSGTACASSFTIQSAHILDPFTGYVSGQKNFSWVFNEISDKAFSINGDTYNYLSMGYLFAPITPMSSNGHLTVTLSDGTNKEIDLQAIKLQANHKTNIAGPFTD